MTDKKRKYELAYTPRNINAVREAIRPAREKERLRRQADNTTIQAQTTALALLMQISKWRKEDSK